MADKYFAKQIVLIEALPRSRQGVFIRAREFHKRQGEWKYLTRMQMHVCSLLKRTSYTPGCTRNLRERVRDMRVKHFRSRELSDRRRIVDLK